MKPYSHPSYNADIIELYAAREHIADDIYNGDRRAVDCCAEMNRLDRLIQRAEESENLPYHP